MSLIEKSFQILKANPKLTGNVKLVVSTDHKIYLESFSINKKLREDRFKHFEIEKEEYYKEVIPPFFDGLENQGIFEAKDLNDDDQTYERFSFQFDDTYFSGARFVEDNYYKEEYEYHAPIYYKPDKLPTDFIILRIDGPGSISTDLSKDNFRSEIIDKWKFVTRFDLTEESDFGKWFKMNFVDDDTIPIYPLEILHGDIEFSKVSGIDLEYGGWVTKYDNLKEFQSKNTPIFKSEEFITNLFEENKVIYPHILNLKFLFDDTPATPNGLREYSINRYIGFYIDEKVLLDSVYSYSGFELNKIAFEKLEELSAVEVSEIPYLKNNIFVREVGSRYYSYDPIKNGWNNNQTYWIEFNNTFYRLERVDNIVEDPFELDVIIGEYLYRVISDINIEHSVDNLITDTDPEVIKQTKKVLINELSQGEKRIKITPNTQFNDQTINNLFENVYSEFTTLVRQYEYVEINNVQKYLFRIQLESSINNNIFEIENYNEADLHLIEIQNQYYVIKRYEDDVPNIGGKYYIQTDYALRVDNLRIEKWINNGINTQDTDYWSRTNIENIPIDQNIPFYKIYRINFTDIKDFDFERIETDYSKYEYEKQYEVKPNLEPKLYAKEYRNLSVTVNTLDKNIARRIPILDINNRPLNIRAQNGELNPRTGLEYTEDDLYYKNIKGEFVLYEGELDNQEWVGYEKETLNIKREFYREENYIYRIEDENGFVLANVDFLSNSETKEIYEELTYGINNLNEISDTKLELPNIKSSNPLEEIDINYVPVSSEYVASDELWEIKNNDLTPIWNKNQNICKWSFLNSIGLHDYPYRLNYSLDMSGANNREPNRNTNREFPERDELNLDYFYRFGLQNSEQYENHSLHLSESYFDIDKYFSLDFNYFDYLFKSDQVTSVGLKNTYKYSLVSVNDSYTTPFTLFKGVKYLISDVGEIVIDEEELAESNTLLIEDIIPVGDNTKYKDYKFSIIFGRKMSIFNNNPGNGNSNSGIDIYVNDYWKNILIHIYINTDDVIQITNPNTLTLVNAENTEIDYWYEDNLDRENQDPISWARSEFKINNFGINLRPRDFMLWEFINILENYNYEPTDLPKEKINFIHIYEDGTHKIMDYSNTDFFITTEQPSEIVIKEEAFITTPIPKRRLPEFDINNTLENRLIVDDDPNAIGGDPNFTIDGLRVDSLNDLNSYYNYPIAKEIKENQIDRRLSFELDNETDPSLFRYNGPYVPIFKPLRLFRPYSYMNLKSSVNNIPKLKDGNWKFYDPSSDPSQPQLYGFGRIDEMLFSKVNRVSTPLKINDPNNQERSIYPMVDEYGYDFDSRFLFRSNWEKTFFYESKLIDISPNEKTDKAGYTIHYDGIKEFIKIEDSAKLNIGKFLLDDITYKQATNIKPDFGEIIGKDKQLILKSTNITTFDFKLLAYKIYDIKLEMLNFEYDIDLGLDSEDIEITIEIIKDPNNIDQQNFNNDLYLRKILGNYNTFNSTTTSDEKVFLTHKYTNILSDADYTYGTGLKYDSLLDIPLEFVQDYYINVRMSVKIFDPAISSMLVNMNVDLIQDGLNDVENMYINKPNFLMIDIGEDENKNGFSNISNIELQSWSGFFKLDDEAGDLMNYLKTVTDWNYSSGLNNTDINTERILNLNNEYWEQRNGFRVYLNDYDNSDNIKNYKEFYNPGLPVVNITETELNNIPLSNYIKLIGNDPNNTFIDETNTLGYLLKDQGFYTFADNNTETNPLIRIANSKPFRFEPDRQTYAKDGKSFIYVEDINGVLTQPYVILSFFYDAAQEKRNRMIFNIIPDNGQTIEINVGLRTNTEDVIKDIKTIIDEINNQIEEQQGNYVVQVLNSSFLYSATYAYPIIIKSKGNDTNILDTLSPLNPSNIDYQTSPIPLEILKGSYYNFNIDIDKKRTVDFLTFEEDDLVMSNGVEKSLSRKYTKSSIKDIGERVNGYLNEITIEFWVKVDNWTKNYETLIYKGEDTSSDVWLDETFTNFTYIIGKFGDQEKLAFKTAHKNLNNEVVTHILSSEKEIDDGEWHHLAFSCELNNRVKNIYIDDELDSFEEDYLEDKTSNGNGINIVYDIPEERELVAIFLDNLNRFLPGEELPSLGDPLTLANKIRIKATDTQTLYWFDVIRGLRNINYFDKEFQLKKWGATIVDTYKVFKDNYVSMKYYLNAHDTETVSELNWDILIGTDSTVSNGRRNFEGSLDELRIWNYARTEEQIITNYRYIIRPESQIDPINSLIAYYRFDEGQGVNRINDLMNSYAINDVVRWSMVEVKISDDGFKEEEISTTTHLLFEKSYYDDAYIEIDDSIVDWEVSGAMILGISDERIEVEQPDPILTRNPSKIVKPVFKRTRNMLKKRRKRRLIFNVDTRIFKVTKERSYTFKRRKWWLFKKVDVRKKERLDSSKIKTSIRRRGKEWLLKYQELIRKNR